MGTTVVLDTCVLLADPDSLYAFGDADIVIPLTVIEELDGHKSRLDDVGRAARTVVRDLERLRVDSGGDFREPVALPTGGTVRVAINGLVVEQLAAHRPQSRQGRQPHPGRRPRPHAGRARGQGRLGRRRPADQGLAARPGGRGLPPGQQGPRRPRRAGLAQGRIQPGADRRPLRRRGGADPGRLRRHRDQRVRRPLRRVVVRAGPGVRRPAPPRRTPPPGLGPQRPFQGADLRPRPAHGPRRLRRGPVGLRRDGQDDPGPRRRPRAGDGAGPRPPLPLRQAGHLPAGGGPRQGRPRLPPRRPGGEAVARGWPPSSTT